MRDVVRRYDVLMAVTIAFLALILLVPNTQIYRGVFYLGVLPAFVLAADPLTLSAVTRSWVWRFAIALLVYLWLTLLWADAPRGIDFFNFARRLVMIGLFVTIIAFLAASRDQFCKWLFRILLPLAALLAIASIAADSARMYLSWHRAGVFGLGSPNVAGAVYSTLLAGGIFFVLQTKQPRWQQVLYGLSLVIMAILIMLTKSRGVLLAVAAMFVVLALVTRRRALLAAMAAAFVAFAVLVGVGLVDFGDLFARGDSRRLVAWRHYWAIWQDHVWGIGLNHDPIFAVPDGEPIWHAHNVYLAYLTYGGLPALVLFLAMLLAALRTAVTTYARSGDAILLAMLVFVMIYDLGDFSIFAENANYTWLHFWLPIGLIAGAEARNLQPGAAAEGTA
jgi:O-antigen ligase